jgi:hypothetical protein
MSAINHRDGPESPVASSTSRLSRNLDGPVSELNKPVVRLVPCLFNLFFVLPSGPQKS